MDYKMCYFTFWKIFSNPAVVIKNMSSNILTALSHFQMDSGQKISNPVAECEDLLSPLSSYSGVMAEHCFIG